MERTEGTLLNGRISYAQPRHGYRTGIEPVFLAAAVPAQPGQRVLEAGCGAGAALLCLLWRVPGVDVTGVEIDPDMAALARANLIENGFVASVETADVTAATLPGPFDHVIANPPWHDPAATRPPLARRAIATHGGQLAHWITALARVVARDGTLTLALAANLVTDAAMGLKGAGLGWVAVLPLLPKVERPAKLALVQGRHSQAGIETRSGFILHEADGRYTAAADAVLRDSAALPWVGCSCTPPQRQAAS